METTNEMEAVALQAGDVFSLDGELWVRAKRVTISHRRIGDVDRVIVVDERGFSHVLRADRVLYVR